MSPKELPTDAEKLRCEIKDMIPELSGRRTQDSATVIRNARGNLCYGGDSLGKKVKSLTLMLSISNLSDRRWTVVYFDHKTTVELRKGSFFIPLSEKALCEEAPNECTQVPEGYYDEIQRDGLVMFMNRGSAALFILLELSGNQSSSPLC
ncbi:hypothetical protein VTN49DRAFT_5418 [Thermomyces lanuginosus]|uniref:uncharacterized protein n=1 Tax=Thermomyces lanuginosus TaxID=5541 RepID=UPI003743C849